MNAGNRFTPFVLTSICGYSDLMDRRVRQKDRFIIINDDGEQQAKVGANLPARFELELVDGYLNRLSLQHCVARPGFTK